MSIDVNHADGPLLGDGTEDGQRNQMVAARRNGQDACVVDLDEEPLDPTQGIHQVDGIDRRVPEIGDLRQPVRRDAADVMHFAHETRHIADFARAVPGAGPICRSAVPGNSDQANIQARRMGPVWQAHERGNAAETRHDGGIDRLEVCFIHSKNPSTKPRQRSPACLFKSIPAIEYISGDRIRKLISFTTLISISGK
jgi:hypothetical protein